VDADEVPVAIVGIVPTKVSTENGAIQVGDLLTTCAHTRLRHEGLANCQSRSDSLFDREQFCGKALEPLKQGKSVIKVLVTLR
jgi:hypothetical protein